jgi:hypothetical protein
MRYPEVLSLLGRMLASAAGVFLAFAVWLVMVLLSMPHPPAPPSFTVTLTGAVFVAAGFSLGLVVGAPDRLSAKRAARGVSVVPGGVRGRSCLDVPVRRNDGRHGRDRSGSPAVAVWTRCQHGEVRRRRSAQERGRTQLIAEVGSPTTSWPKTMTGDGD